MGICSLVLVEDMAHTVVDSLVLVLMVVGKECIVVDPLALVVLALVDAGLARNLADS